MDFVLGAVERHLRLFFPRFQPGKYLGWISFRTGNYGNHVEDHLDMRRRGGSETS